MGRAISISWAVKCGASALSQASRSLSDSFEMVIMLSPATVTARLSGRRRAPAQSGQGWLVNRSSSFSR
jgi:hypothetical protein